MIPPSADRKQDSDPLQKPRVETLHSSSIRLPTATWRNQNLPGNKNNWHSREVDGKTWQKGMRWEDNRKREFKQDSSGCLYTKQHG